MRLVTQAGPSRASLFSLTLTGVSGLRRLEMIPVKTVSNTGWRTGQCKVRIPLWASSWRVSKAWSLLGKVTVTLGRGLGQARYEYLWKSSLVGVAAWKSSSTSERLHGRLGSHLDEDVAPAVVVDTRNHLGVDLGDGEA